MAEVGSLQVDHSYKRVVESWFPDLFQKEQPKSKASDAGATKRESGKNGSQPESTATISGEKSPLKSPKKKKQTVPIATKIGSLVEGKILPKLKKRQQVQQWEQTESKAPTANSNTTESEDQDSKLNSLSQRKQPGGQPQTGHEMTGQSQGGHKMSRSQVRRMKRRQKKAMEQQTAGRQDVPVTGQFPTLENLLQSPSKVPQGKAEDIGQNKDEEKSTGKKNIGPKQSTSHAGVNLSLTVDAEQVGNAEEDAGDGKKKRKRRKAKKVVTPEEQEPHAPVEPLPIKKPKLQNQPDLLGGAARQTPEKSTTSVSSVSPTGQKTSPAKKEKKKKKNPLVAEQGSEKKTVEDNIVSNIEETAAKKQRLSTENTEEGSHSTANVATSDAQPTGALKRKRRRARRRKRTSSEQSQSSEIGGSTAVEPASKEEGGTVSPAKPEGEPVTTLSPKMKRKRKKRRR
ncbi:Hypp3398 [Branchiostoma lanceolatum]|uniref:Hypp3398 protein n=1 Tax=Branchiostoma lanceolatum TaxID=7740 RepID=A0A8K0A224_BRALA|nr:Hypp3398 [Branchiostoma lanceolatum]